jgi:hypothetical protein
MTTPPRDPRRAAVAAGVVAMLLCYVIAKVLRAAAVPAASEGLSFAVVGVVFAVAGVVAGRASSRVDTGAMAIARPTGHVLVGVPLGVIVWALGVEFLLHLVAPGLSQDHNLFPFEIVMYWIFATVPVAIGVGVGRVSVGSREL